MVEGRALRGQPSRLRAPPPGLRRGRLGKAAESADVVKKNRKQLRGGATTADESKRAACWGRPFRLMSDLAGVGK
jgi:hypothetical protein